MKGYTDQTVKWEIEVSAHSIARFRKRFLGLDYKSAVNISTEIADIIYSLFQQAVPYARAQHNVLVFHALWCDNLGKFHDVYLIIHFSAKRGGIKLRTVMNDKLAQKYIAKGTWKPI